MDTSAIELIYIEAYLSKIGEADQPVTFADFFETELQFILDHTPSDKLDRIETIWAARFGNAAKKLGIEIVPTTQRPVAVSTIIQNMKLRRQDCVSAKSSSSSKSNSRMLTPEAKAEFKAKYEAMDETKKWVIREGVCVEDLMYQFGMQCTHEHAVHSFTLCVDDVCWQDVFKSDLQIIRDYGNNCLPVLGNDINNILEKYKDIYEQDDPLDYMIKATNSLGFYDPRKAYDEWWLLSAINQFCAFYSNATLEQSYMWSEMDFATKVWGILDRCFEDMNVLPGRDRRCHATARRVNSHRYVTGIGEIARKQPSTRPDLVLLKDNIEYGCSELGKKDDPSTTAKEIIETQLHCPKTMRDMFCSAAEHVDMDRNVVRELKIICFHQTALRMKMSVLDCPNGYVCRVSESYEYEIPKKPNLVFAQLLSILQLALQAKIIVKNSIKAIEDYISSTTQKSMTPTFKSPDTASNKIIIPPSLTTPLPVSTTKRKRPSTDTSNNE